MFIQKIISYDGYSFDVVTKRGSLADVDELHYRQVDDLYYC